MDQEQLRYQYSRLLRSDDIMQTFEMIDIYKNCLFSMFLDLKRDREDTSMQADCKMLPQMLFTKLAHLETACQGIVYQSRDGSKTLNRIIDPTVISTLIRSIFEQVSLFNMVFVSQEEIQEQQLIYLLWVISGLSYRQRFADYLSSEETIRKCEEEKKQIENYKKSIENHPLFTGASEQGKDKIRWCIKKKKFALYFDNGEPKILNGFHDIALRAGFRKKVMGEMYNYFSLSAHPTNVSVFQFAQMFNHGGPEFMRNTVFNMTNTFMLLGAFIADLLKVFPKLNETFDRLPVLDQCIINHYNVFGRSEEHSINDCLNALG